MRIFAEVGHGCTLAHIITQAVKTGIITQADSDRFQGTNAPQFLEIPAGKEREMHFMLKCIDTEIYKFRVEDAPQAVDPIRKTMFVEDWDACLK
jgi:hypothetical protein